MGVVEVITVVYVGCAVGGVQIVPRKVGLDVGDTAVQSNDDDTDEGVVPPLYETPAGTLTVANEGSPVNA